MKSQVWFLTGSQHLYGPETLDQVAAQSAEIPPDAVRICWICCDCAATWSRVSGP